MNDELKKSIKESGFSEKFDKSISITLNSYKYMDMVIKKNIERLSFENWDFGEEMSGAYGCTHKKYNIAVYATPFWEEEDGIPFEINTNEDQDYELIPFSITGNNNVDFDNYEKILKRKIKFLDGLIAAVF